MKKPQSYTINISYNPPPIPLNDFNWECSLLDDETVNAHGKTPEQALANFRSVFEDYLDRQDELIAEKERIEARQCYLEDLAKAQRRGEI